MLQFCFAMKIISNYIVNVAKLFVQLSNLMVFNWAKPAMKDRCIVCADEELCCECAPRDVAHIQAHATRVESERR